MPSRGNIHQWPRMTSSPGQPRKAPPTVRPSSLPRKGRRDSITERALAALNADSSSDDGGTVASGVSSADRGKTPVKIGASLQKSPGGSIGQGASGVAPKLTVSVPVAGSTIQNTNNGLKEFNHPKAAIKLSIPQKFVAGKANASMQRDSGGMQTDSIGSSKKASVHSTDSTKVLSSSPKVSNNGLVSLQQPSTVGIRKDNSANTKQLTVKNQNSPGSLSKSKQISVKTYKNQGKHPSKISDYRNFSFDYDVTSNSTQFKAKLKAERAKIPTITSPSQLKWYKTRQRREDKWIFSIKPCRVISREASRVIKEYYLNNSKGDVVIQFLSVMNTGGYECVNDISLFPFHAEDGTTVDTACLAQYVRQQSRKFRSEDVEAERLFLLRVFEHVAQVESETKDRAHGDLQNCHADNNSTTNKTSIFKDSSDCKVDEEDTPNRGMGANGNNKLTQGKPSHEGEVESNGAQNVVDLTLDSSDEEDALAAPAPIPGVSSTTRMEDKSKDCNIKALRTIDSNKPASQEKKPNKSSPPSQPAKFVNEQVPYLHGKLTVSNDVESRSLVLRGIWGYENTPSYTPQRFELISKLSPEDADPTVLPPFRQFHGSFIYKSTSDKDVTTVIEEKDVNLTFNATEDNPGLFKVKGSGANQFGRFELNGSARANESAGTLSNKCGFSYTLKLAKTYVEIFPAAALPATVKSNISENMCSKKRKASDSDSESSASKSAKSSSPDVSTDTSDSLAFEDKPACDGPSTQQLRRKRTDTLFDQVELADSIETNRSSFVHWSSRSTQPIRTASTQPLKKPKIEHYAMSGVVIKHQPRSQHPKPKPQPHYTWTLKDVRPPFSKMTRDFLESEGIHFVNDLLKADAVNLYVKLMASRGFKLACALAAWRSQQSFRNIYKLSLAKLSIEKWINVAKAWWRKTTLSDWSSQNGLLSNVLDPQEALTLETKLGIVTANQLLMSSKSDIIKILREVIDFGNINRTDGDLDCICEGMMYSFLMRARGKYSNSVACQSECLPSIRMNNIKSKSTDEKPSECIIKTPMSCLDFLFIKSQNITSDEELSRIDLCNKINSYCSFLEKNNHKTTFVEASNNIRKWIIDASKYLGKACNSGSAKDEKELSYPTRLDRSHKSLKVMCNISHLSRISMVNGLPTKNIFCFDDANDALYKFRVHVEQSGVSPNAGNGAFLTYQGCRVLKESSHWKKKKLSDIRTKKQTRNPLTAVFSGGQAPATVTLKGKQIHGDEYLYGPDNGIGTYNEYTLDDFMEVDNVTFSSSHAGCALIELDRYAPLLPVDRKTVDIFAMKDFIFSHEPSSWRFDVSEELNGHKQVVDFTDDATGSPHSVARSHMSMYVNEVGHNAALVENVRPLEINSRSVFYYVCINKPMKKGDKVELLVNYGDHYEDMRERRGYGKSNSLGIESDDHDPSRVRRNLKDRMEVEDLILSCTEEEIYSALDFFRTRVWGGLVASTSRSTPGDNEISTYRRQSIARRRLHWIVEKFRIRSLQLREEQGPANRAEKLGMSSFDIGMFVYVNGWMPPHDPRPPYSGIASILSRSKDKFDRLTFNLSIPGSHKTIYNVPEGVITEPVEDDFANSSNTVIRTWNKKIQGRNFIPLRQQMLTMLDTSFQWDSSFIQQACPEIREKLLVDYRWEFAEELLHHAAKHKRLLAPFDGTKWCLMSQSLLQNVLHAVADYTLFDESSSHQRLNVLCATILSLASDSAKVLKEISSQSICALSLLEDSTRNTRLLVAKSIRANKMSVDEYRNNPQPLDLEWYLCNQIVMAIHPLASLIHWKDAGYSFQVLCDRVGLDLDSPYLSNEQAKLKSWNPLLSI